MEKIYLLIGRERREADAKVEPPNADGSFHAQVAGYTKEELVPFLGPSETGALYTEIKSKRYLVKELTSEGLFKAVPDVKA